MREKAIAFLAGLLILAATALSSAQTLGEALKARSIDTTGLSDVRLALRITSFASLDDAEVFAIAYYPDDGSGRLGDSLYVDLLEKRAGRWVSSQLRRDAPQGVNFGGSVLEIIRLGDFLYLNTHVNPSAAYTLALTRDLKYSASIYGWPLAVLPDGLLIFQNSQLHFAPTHYAEISVFDPRSKRSWLIYPRWPFQAARREHMEKVCTAYAKRGEQWFREHNHHGNPELFDSYRRGDVAVNPATRAAAFPIGFDNTDTWDFSEKVKFLQFGGLYESLKGFQPTDSLPKELFVILGQGLYYMQPPIGHDSFLCLFEGDPELHGMLRLAVAELGQPGADWRKHFVALDPRWEKRDVWERILRTLATPPPSTDVIVILRNIDREDAVECREIPASDFEKRFGDIPLDEVLTPARLKQVFGD